jgi:DNA-binding winged helix-turn-helix (wHTH) protein
MSARSSRIAAMTSIQEIGLGDLRVLPGRLRVLRDGEEIALEPRMMEVLVAMCERAGEVVSAEQLLIEVWRGTFYGDNPVQKTIAELRRRLGDSSRAPRYIETIRKRGYRLIAEVVFADGYRPGASVPGSWSGDRPYIGLQPFAAEHAPLFFGRSRVIAEVLGALRRQVDSGRSLVLISGSSGCGKTSLVEAGVLPLLTQAGGFQGRQALSVARLDLARRRGGDVASALADALCQWRLQQREVFVRGELPTDAATWDDQRCAIKARVEHAFARQCERQPRAAAHSFLMLVVDHLEAAVAGPAWCEHERRSLGAALSALCGCRRIAVLAITRSDFYPRLIDSLPELAELKSGYGQIDLLPPRPGEIAQIIRAPAALAGLHFDVDLDTGARLDDVLRDAAAGQPDALPLLAHALRALDEGRASGGLLSFQCYRDFGGLEGALAYRAEQCFRALPASAQSRLGAVLSALTVVSIDSAATTARRARRALFPDKPAEQLIDAFVDVRLFVAELSEGEPVFGVAHEALLRQWPRAAAWIADNRELLQARERLRESARRWSDDGRSPDRLLNPGRPLEEARRVLRRMSAQLQSSERAFVLASESARRRQRRRRLSSLAALTASLAAALFLGFQTYDARVENSHRRNQAQNLVGFMLEEQTDRLRPLGNLDLLDNLSQAALGYLQSLPEADLRAPELISRSQALRTLGEVQMGKAHFDEARRAFEAASRATQAAGRLAPSSVDVLAESGRTAYWLGYLDFRERRLDRAELHWAAYLRSSEAWLARAPGDREARLELSYALSNLGTLAQRRRQLDQAADLFTRSLTLKHALLAEQSEDQGRENQGLEYELIDSLSWLSATREAQGQLQHAAADYETQLRMLRALVEREPTADAWRRRLATSLLRSSSLALDRGHLRTAYAQAEESRALLLELTTQRPENQEWRRDLGHAQAQAGWISMHVGEALRARRELEAAHQTLLPLMRLRDALPEWRLLDAVVRLRRLQASAERVPPQLLDPIVLDLEALHRSLPDDTKIAAALAQALAWRGDLRQDHAAPDEARSDWLRGRALLSASGDASDRRLLDLRVRLYTRLGESEEVRGDLAQLEAMGYRHPDFLEFLPPTHQGASL